jgi:hypothetical protein
VQLQRPSRDEQVLLSSLYPALSPGVTTTLSIRTWHSASSHPAPQTEIEQHLLVLRRLPTGSSVIDLSIDLSIITAVSKSLSYACACHNAEGMKKANIRFKLWGDEKREKKNERKEDRMGTKKAVKFYEVRL